MEPFDYAATGVGGLGSAYAEFGLQQAEPPRWRGGILFDGAILEGISSTTAGGQDTAAQISDVGYFSLLAISAVPDPMVAWLARDEPKLAAQLLGMNLETMAIAGFSAILTTKVAGRERPRSPECYDDPAGCPGQNESVSFPSGHTTMAFTSASLLIVHHAYNPLYGGGAARVVADSFVGAAAATTGITRIVARAHHPTDVIAGALWGMGIGTAVPVLLHYEWDAGNQPPVTVTPMAGNNRIGLSFDIRWDELVLGR